MAEAQSALILAVLQLVAVVPALLPALGVVQPEVLLAEVLLVEVLVEVGLVVAVVVEAAAAVVVMRKWKVGHRLRGDHDWAAIAATTLFCPFRSLVR